MTPNPYARHGQSALLMNLRLQQRLNLTIVRVEFSLKCELCH